MLKYLLALLAGVATLFALTFISAEMTVHSGAQLGKYLIALLTLAAARGTYVYFRNRDRERNFGSTLPSAAGKRDIKNFEKIFRHIDCAALGITEVIVVEREDSNEIGFYVGIRKTNAEPLDEEFLRAEMHEVFFPHITFEFIDLDSDRGKLLFVSGVKINLKA